VRFLCDDNLGRLAGYLRILGFDTLFYENIDDAALLKLAANDERFLITRDHKLASKSIPHGLLIIEDDAPLKQLSTVVLELDLTVDTNSLFARCSRCNILCHDVDKDSLAGKVFPFILKTQPQIKRCPSCGRYYWKGSHYKVLLRKLRSVIDDSHVAGKWPEQTSDESPAAL